MIIVCPNCSSRLQLDETKAPARPLSVRCPKCGGTVNWSATSPASEKGALAIGSSPATGDPRLEEGVPVPAPLFELEQNGTANGPSVSPVEELGRLLASLVPQNGGVSGIPTTRPSWNPRKVLVCATEPQGHTVARHLTQNGYQVFVAKETKQAVERMRENQLDVVILDPDFDAAEQGAAFVTREVNVLRPAQRRRLFFVLLSPSLRTMESHAAFLRNFNGIVNSKEIEELPKILENALRSFNELYKDFNLALNTPAL